MLNVSAFRYASLMSLSTDQNVSLRFGHRQADDAHSSACKEGQCDIGSHRSGASAKPSAAAKQRGAKTKKSTQSTHPHSQACQSGTCHHADHQRPQQSQSCLGRVLRLPLDAALFLAEFVGGILKDLGSLVGIGPKRPG